MKRYMSQKICLLSLLIMSVFISALAGCGGGGGGSWTEPGTPGGPGGARPLVVSSVPVKSSPIANVQPDTVVSVTFNKDMAPASILAAGVFTVTGPGSTLVSGRTTNPVTYNAANRTATFHPAAVLAPGTYTATIKGTGINTANDTTGNALAGNATLPLVANDYVWSFTTSLTAPVIRPTVISSVPAKSPPVSTVQPSTPVTATFDKDMLPASILAAGVFTVTDAGSVLVPGAATPVSYDAATRTATFHPAAALAPGTYTATIKGTGTNAATDTLGNALAGVSTSPAVANDYVWSFTTAFVTPPGNINDLMSYGIASAGGITNSGATKINGNVVLNPLDRCNNVLVGSTDNFGLCAGAAPTNNFGDKVITKTYPDAFTGDSIMAQLLTKWNSISPAGTPGGTVLGCGVIGSAGGGGTGIGCAGNSTLPAGTYIANIASIDISGVLTLNGSATDVWIFQAPSSTVITAVNSSIVLTGGAKASNVWWFVGSSADLKAGTTFQGNILASASISMGTGSTSCGRLLAGAEGAGAFTFLANTVSVPGHPNAPAGCQ